MRIYSKKSFRFDHPANAVDPVLVQTGFADVPDWVEDSTMFKLASRDDSVMLIENKQDEITAENGGKTLSAKEKREAEAKAKAEAEAKQKAEEEAATAAAAAGASGNQ